MQPISRSQRFISRPEFGPFVLLIIELVVFSLMAPAFLSQGNISNLLAFTPELGMISLGMTMLMTSGEFDLSVGSVFGFTPVVMWTIFNTGIAPFEIAFLIAMFIALLVGFFNGWFVTRLKIPSFLVTLGMLLVVRGSALYITSGPGCDSRTDGFLVGRNVAAVEGGLNLVARVGGPLLSTL